MENIEIRKAKKEELKEIFDLVWNVFLKFEAIDYPKEAKDEFKNHIKDPEFINKLEIFGAFENDKVVGMIATRNINHIALFYVDGKYQGRGIGRNLYDTIYKLNTDDYFTVNSTPYAKEIYINFGFECHNGIKQVNGIKFYPMKVKIKNKKDSYVKRV